ncbi:hypothetical protein BH23CHL5_BH23CHL5_28840 [soil metagenome]
MRVARTVLTKLLIVITAMSGVDRADAIQESGANPVSIRIPSILVNTRIEPLKIPGGVMDNPHGNWVVGWYDETARLGEPGNVLLYGYRDFKDVGPGVFYFFDQLEEGDLVEVNGDDNQTYRYRVSTSTAYETSSAPLGDIFAESAEPGLILFSFLPPFQEPAGYQTMLVVRATPEAENPILPTQPTAEWNDENCLIAPRRLPLPGGSLKPFEFEEDPAARVALNVSEATETPPETFESIDTFLQWTTDCSITVREALTLPDGRILALVGPSELLPLQKLAVPGNYSMISFDPAATRYEFALFEWDGQDWTAAPVPWTL